MSSTKPNHDYSKSPEMQTLFVIYSVSLNMVLIPLNWDNNDGPRLSEAIHEFMDI